MSLSTYEPTHEEFVEFFKQTKMKSMEDLYKMTIAHNKILKSLSLEEGEDVSKPELINILVKEDLLTITDLRKSNEMILNLKCEDRYGLIETEFQNNLQKDYTIDVSIEKFYNFSFDILYKELNKFKIRLINTKTVDNLPLNCKSKPIEVIIKLIFKD